MGIAWMTFSIHPLLNEQGAPFSTVKMTFKHNKRILQNRLKIDMIFVEKL